MIKQSTVVTFEHDFALGEKVLLKKSVLSCLETGGVPITYIISEMYFKHKTNKVNEKPTSSVRYKIQDGNLEKTGAVTDIDIIRISEIYGFLDDKLEREKAYYELLTKNGNRMLCSFGGKGAIGDKVTCYTCGTTLTDNYITLGGEPGQLPIRHFCNPYKNTCYSTEEARLKKATLT